jgi:hypothetical protein
MKNVEINVIRNNNFFIGSRQIAQDKNLSLESKGLLFFILSLPNNFVLYKDFLLNNSNCGETKFRRIWSELKSTGYLIQEKTQNSLGRYDYKYTIQGNPSLEGNQSTGSFSACGEHTPIINKQTISGGWERVLELFPPNKRNNEIGSIQIWNNLKQKEKQNVMRHLSIYSKEMKKTEYKYMKQIGNYFQSEEWKNMKPKTVKDGSDGMEYINVKKNTNDSTENDLIDLFGQNYYNEIK